MKLYNNIKGVIQWILAFIFKRLFNVLLSLIDIPWALVIGMFSPYARGMAVGEDVLGNYRGKYLFTALFLKKTATLKFGTPVEINGKKLHPTISYVMAEAYYEETLTVNGVTFARILLFFKDKAFNIEST